MVRERIRVPGAEEGKRLNTHPIPQQKTQQTGPGRVKPATCHWLTGLQVDSGVVIRFFIVVCEPVVCSPVVAQQEHACKSFAAPSTTASSPWRSCAIKARATCRMQQGCKVPMC